MEKIVINNFNELIRFLSLPEVSKDEVCKIIADHSWVYADPSMDKDKIIKDLSTYGTTTN